jgi:putative transcriptional regulator
MSKENKSGLLETLRQTAEDFAEAGLFDKQTMKTFDELSLTPVRPLKPQQIKKLREGAKASQTVFARYLNVTPSLISQWERGEKHPSGASLKLLTLIAKNGLRSIA